jgi:Ca2+-binding RTX toxin-like protein
MSASPPNHRRTRSRLAALTAAAVAAMGLAGASSAGATTCTLDNGAMDLTLTADTTVQTAGGTIAVSTPGGQPLTCTGGPTPTTTNTDVIRVLDLSDNPTTPAKYDGSTQLEIRDPQSFAPGATIETGDGPSEVEFVVNMAGGTADRLLATAGTAGVDWTAGTYGFNWIDDSDPDVMGAFDEIVLIGRELGDQISANGARGTGASLKDARVRLVGSRGNDRLVGSQGTDVLDPGPGTDFALGLDSADGLIEDEGDDTFDGGAGPDYVNLIRGTGPATVDLGQTGRQSSGHGRDAFANVESVIGTSFADTLVGNVSANELSGGEGDDLIDGAGGVDVLDGHLGNDAVTYATAPGPVSVDLFAKRAVQGTDVEHVVRFENVIGSPFADNLVGDAEANRIVGGAGVDSVWGANGADRIEVRDGEGDAVSCGDDAAADITIADRRGVDQLNPDCESVEFAPEPDPGTGPVGPDPEPTPDRSLSFKLSGAKAQRLLGQRSVIVKVGCPLEACTTTARVSGRKAVAARAAVPAGTTRTLKLRLTKAQLASIRRALARRRAPTVKVTAEARDAAGNRVTRTLRVRGRR